MASQYLIFFVMQLPYYISFFPSQFVFFFLFDDLLPKPKTTRLMNNANCRYNYNLKLGFKMALKEKLPLFIGLFASWCGFSWNERGLKYDRKDVGEHSYLVEGWKEELMTMFQLTHWWHTQIFYSSKEELYLAQHSFFYK